MVMRALRHRGDGGKLIVMRLNGLEEYMTDLITWQQQVDNLLHNSGQDQTGISERPRWEPRTKADLRSDVIGMIFFTIAFKVVLVTIFKRRQISQYFLEAS